jgi:hypothetical protein
MKLDASRIVLGAVLLAALAGGSFWWDLHRAGPARAADAAHAEASFPVFDIATPSARHTAAVLMAGPDNLVDGQWLGALCRGVEPRSLGDPDRFVMTRFGPTREGDFRRNRLAVLLGVDWGRADVSVSDGLRTPAKTRVTLDADDARAFRQLLLSSAFLRLPPGGRTEPCHGENITMEWCSQGQYYGVMRGCEIDREPGPLTTVADAVDVFVAKRSAR